MTKTSLLIASMLSLAVVALAQPAYVNYQGLLKAADGSPLETGNYTIEFNIYDAANGGTKVWGPFLFDGGSGLGHGLQVPVINGNFNVIIGPMDTSGASIAEAFEAPNRYIEIKVNGGDPILPRQQFLSTAYALQSRKAQDADVASSLIQELAEALCPPGSILAFGGSTNAIPSGWLLCDGRPLASTNYAGLYLAIGAAWGDGTIGADGNPENPPNPATDFNLPDLRGMFLRGVTGTRVPFSTNAPTAWGDPDAATRTNAIGGNVGNNVGSFQRDALQNVSGTIGDFNEYAAFHGTPDGPFYKVNNVKSSTGIGSGSADYYDRILMDLSLAARTSTETRANNVYVNYIIKY